MFQKTTIKKFGIVLCSALLFIGLLGFFSANWYAAVYGDVGFDSILYTILSAMEGTASGLIINYLLRALLPAILIELVLCNLLFASPEKNIFVRIGRKFKLHIPPIPKITAVVCSLVLFLTLLFTGATNVGIVKYVHNNVNPTDFIEKNYVDPAVTDIRFPKVKQNLIMIYLESMETTFLSEELGGGNDINPIPELHALAQEHVNFSQNDGVGGFSALSGGTWTAGALVSSTSGVPLKISPSMDEDNYQKSNFLPGLTTLSNVLHDAGYYQALMVGSISAYGGRKQYYEQHGTDKVYDIFTAREDGIVPDDYYVWWGMEDHYLFAYAKEEITKIAQMDQPFAFSMLTVDTHHVDGYVCQYCQNEHDEQYENVLACSSKQVGAFVNWIQQQDFYENTTIIICGDHPTMDNAFIQEQITADYQRKVYNCFVNAKATTNNTKNREFCTLDLFPTTLAAMGCTIPGDRLGLGTNLFSSVPTFCEEMGKEAFHEALSMGSEYYLNTFY